MRHGKIGRKFGRKKDQRRAFLKSLAANLILHGKIKTTEARAKELRSLVERLIAKTKNSDLTAVRYVEKLMPPAVAGKLVKEVSPKYKERKGGYTRITKLRPRPSDGARMAIIELV